jgi:nitrogen fixation NifU-like protein
MSEINELYQEVILDHNKQPRNFQKLDGANRQGVGYNPLCGDKMTVYLKYDGDLVKDISFLGSGCAISKASGSMMTISVKGKTRAEVEHLFDQFHKMVTGKLEPSVISDMGKLKVFAGVSEFPARVKCAALAWHTLKAAFEGKNETVSTEDDKN